MSQRKKVFLVVLIAVGVLLLSAGIYVAIMFSRIQYTSLDESETLSASMTPSPVIATASPTSSEDTLADSEIAIQDEIMQTELSSEELAHLQANADDQSVTNVLLVGIDRRGSDGPGNTDTMLIGTLDQPNQRLKLTSLMRDMYVDIPGRGGNRINSALSRGGVPLLLKTINTNFKTNLEYYVIIDFNMFENAIDELGGVTINMSSGEVAEANDCIAGLNRQRRKPLRDGFITQREGGDVLLTGKQALGYCRIRHFGDGDHSRTSRQAKVLQEVFRQFKAANPFKQSSMLYTLLPMVETNLSPTQIAGLVTKVLAVDTSDIMHYRLPVEGHYSARRIRGMAVYVPDISANAQKLHWFLYEATEIDPLPYSDTQKGSYHRVKEPRRAARPAAAPIATAAPTVSPETAPKNSEIAPDPSSAAPTSPLPAENETAPQEPTDDSRTEEETTSTEESNAPVSSEEEPSADTAAPPETAAETAAPTSDITVDEDAA